MTGQRQRGSPDSDAALARIEALLTSLVGLIIPGGCTYCNAEQEMMPEDDGVFVT